MAANVHQNFTEENRPAMPRIVQFQHVAPSKQDPDGGFFALTSDGRIYSVKQNAAQGTFVWQEIKTPDLGPDNPEPQAQKEMLGTLAVAEFALANCHEVLHGPAAGGNSIQQAALMAVRRLLRDQNVDSRVQVRVGPAPSVPMSKERVDEILAKRETTAAAKS